MKLEKIGTYKIRDNFGTFQDPVQPVHRGRERDTDYVDCYFVGERTQRIRFFFEMKRYGEFMKHVLKYCEDYHLRVSK